MMNLTMAKSESEFLNIILVGINARYEVPFINASFRKRAMSDSSTIEVFTSGLGLTYTTFPVENIGNTYATFIESLKGKL
jgi:hypothetical protein